MHPNDPASPSRALAWGLPPLLLIAAAVVRHGAALNHDVAWLLVAAGRLLDGGSYASDFFEINMPLAIIVYAPAQWLARYAGLSLSDATLTWVLALAAQCTWLCTAILSRAGFVSRRMLPWLSAWILLGCMLLPGYDFAQREHLVILLGLPFVLRMAAPVGSVPAPLARYSALLAGIGFFLKPHFAGVPLLLVAASALREKSWKPFFSGESVMLVAVALANTAMVIALFPDWFVCARWARDLYGEFRSSGWTELASPRNLPALGVAVLALGIVMWRDARYRASTASLALAGSYCLVVYVLQFKGWSYQLIPFAICTFAAAGIALFSCVERMQRSQADGRSQLPFAALAAGALAICSVDAALRTPPGAAVLRSPIAEALSPAAPGDYVYGFTTTVVPIFPTVVLMNLGWASRYPSLWPLGGIVQGESSAQHDKEIWTRYRRELVDAVVGDFERYAPKVVLVDRRSGQFGLPDNYDLLAPFLGDARFSKIWNDYEKIGSGQGFDIFVRERG